MTKILVVDDEDQILRVLRPSLETAGYIVQTATDGASALESLSSPGIDAMILDLGLPDMDGKEIITQAARESHIPIIVLSARGSETEKIDALDRGARDYIPKPFTIGELLARLRAVLRPPKPPRAGDQFYAKDLHIDFANRRMTVRTTQFRLSGRETELLRVLAGARGQVVSHRQLISAIWTNKSDVDSQYVRVLVNQLRQKIESEPGGTGILLTEAGLGYRLGIPDSDVKAC